MDNTAHPENEKSFGRRGFALVGLAGLAAVGSGLTLQGASAAATNYNFGPNTLYRGVKNNYVKTLQTALNYRINANLPCITTFGPATEAAVKSFQKSRGLTVDGRVGPATKTALNKDAAAAPAPAPAAVYHNPVSKITPVTGGVPIKSGWNGTRVRLIQKKLGINRTSSGQTYDSATRSAVISFQKKNGLAADGVVGAKTWTKMFGSQYPFNMDAWQTSVRVPTNASRTQRIEEFIRFAQSVKGSPYTWGGAGWKDPSIAGYDCSGLVLQSLYSAGIDPQPINVVKHAEPSYRTSQMLYADKKLRSIPLANRQRGDIIFYGDSGGTVRHCTIYLGNNRMIHAANPNVYELAYAGTLWGNRFVKPTVKRII